MNAPEKRKPGRPKGSKNKRKGLSAQNVRQICEFHKFNPAEKLIAIAMDTDSDSNGNPINWPLAYQARAAEKLFDAVHNNKNLPGIGDDGGDSGNQYEIVFIEGGAGFELPGAASTEGAAGVVSGESVCGIGLPPSDGENSIRDQLDDSRHTDL